MLHRSPRLFGLERSRWWLAGLAQVISWLGQCSLAGICQILKRLGLHYKRGQAYVHSPDADYELKLSYIQVAEKLARTQPEDYILLYQDELTYYRRPSLARAYALVGQQASRVTQGYTRNRPRRISGCLNPITGQVDTWQRAHFDRHTLIRFYQAVANLYPTAKTIFLVQDNWSVHRHPDILQFFMQSRIVPLWLPTYAPWTNPVEKIWLRLKQELLHHHDFQDNWQDLKLAIQHWLEHCDDDPDDLLRYLGLSYP